MGTKRARMTALPPYCSKNVCARLRCSRLSSLFEIPELPVALKTRGPIERPTV